MNIELSHSDWDTVLFCLTDYEKLLKAGMSLRYKLTEERDKVLPELVQIIAVIVDQWRKQGGRTERDTGGHDLTPRSTDAHGDNAAGDRRADRGHSSAGADTAHRSDEPERWPLPDTLGGEEDASAPDDGENDDTSDGPHGE